MQKTSKLAKITIILEVFKFALSLWLSLFILTVFKSKQFKCLSLY